ncbi:glycoside hydrolase family 5 protein [Rhizomonospora bruguierae]|uniref:glycoside hydrolase family 5 protein n=1 Tax=Rhizomonospora bruguierae TaxID=1581705 RepID=UPI001BCBF9C2|nr:cellulase family glycosylhydrolase [Micromonospora sp. NBRC 107566]
MDSPTLSWLRVDGDRLRDEAGAVVRLTGFGLGGWLNMENFITGYPGNEQNIRRVMFEAMGEEAYRAFFDEFLEGFFTDADAALLAGIGLNSVRIPVNYRHFEDDAAPFALKEEGFAHLDRVITTLARHGLYSVIDLHALPGRQNEHWHSDNATHIAEFWAQRHFQDRVVHLWEALADRYRNRPEVAGYNPINEPSDRTGRVLPAFYDRLEKAIRAIDPRHILFLDGNRYSSDFSVFEGSDPLPNTVYTAHDYALPGIAGDATDYPGTVRGEYFDRSVVERAFLRRTTFMRETGTPIWIGEFGPVHPREQEWRYRLLRDQLDIYRDHGASWALWTYKDIGLQGIAYASPDSGYLRHVKPILDTKARLGVDAWAGRDDNVRDILDPIEALFDREFPEYQPWPWGRRQHIALLVRHILLAEPLAERYGELFRGVPPEQARELAASFRFENCVLRDGLVETLRAHLAAEHAGEQATEQPDR